jgi:hypothetical protein
MVPQHLSRLENGYLLMGLGGGWLLVAKVLMARFGDEAKLLKNPTYALSSVEQLKRIRPIFDGIARWFVRPAAWVMLVVGASMFIAGVIESAQSSVPGVQ